MNKYGKTHFTDFLTDRILACLKVSISMNHHTSDTPKSPVLKEVKVDKNEYYVFLLCTYSVACFIFSYLFQLITQFFYKYK